MDQVPKNSKYNLSISKVPETWSFPPANDYKGIGITEEDIASVNMVELQSPAPKVKLLSADCEG